MHPVDFNTRGYFARKPHVQALFAACAMTTAFIINRYQASAQGGAFENHVPTAEMWSWYDKHCARQGENQDIVMKDHSVNIPHMMGRFDHRQDDQSANPFNASKK
ncbi:hypothetical protein FDP41_001228 [Naegleria fowleri]|uniref:Uncharacterized protein n=1 Tax=Naegleria fowleri TaxID=5763 RepID=A0A6A5C3K9_NAEFO|nr:uncharacterized protein FDP41_001228 [Naegleria fowleri]KAF0980075.1 hypothetical protein FDP41_001228 [Naegleria fowleri]CAG4716095.1 unnamed protein product [Naegleria fowleri]